jgi:hypothetical protein
LGGPSASRCGIEWRRHHGHRWRHEPGQRKRKFSPLVVLRGQLEVKAADISPQTLVLAAGVGVALVVLWQARKAAAAVADAIKAGAVDPTSSNNLAYRASNAVGGAVTGDANYSMGAHLWEWLNPGAAAAEVAAVRGPVAKPAPAPVAVLPPAPSVGPAWAGQVTGYQYPGIVGP